MPKVPLSCAKTGILIVTVLILVYAFLSAGAHRLIDMASRHFAAMSEPETSEAETSEAETSEAETSEAETDPEEWRKLLQEMSDLAIADPENRDRLTSEQIEKRWLGEPPATDEEIAATEQRLGVKLPPSYRAFLKVSNGWNLPNSFVVRLGSTEEIGWTRDKDPGLVRGFNEGVEHGRQQYGDIPPAPEDNLPDTLQINLPHEDDDSASFMLNPKTISNEEMEAWFFSAWNPGANAYPSFWHLMVDQRDPLRSMRDLQ